MLKNATSYVWKCQGTRCKNMQRVEVGGRRGWEEEGGAGGRGEGEGCNELRGGKGCNELRSHCFGSHDIFTPHRGRRRGEPHWEQIRIQRYGAHTRAPGSVPCTSMAERVSDTTRRHPTRSYTPWWGFSGCRVEEEERILRLSSCEDGGGPPTTV